jgi:hypothetical protein
MANEFKIKNGYLSEGNSQITGSLNVSAGITGSLFGTSSYAIQALSSSYYGGSVTSASYAATASYLNTLNQDLTFNGNLTLNGTASITYLNVSYESASVIYSTGSNQFGDAANDTQTLYGSVIIPTGSLTVSGALAVSSSQNSYFVGGGNVGIGTTNPGAKLTVDDSTPFIWGFPSSASAKIGTSGTGGSFMVMTPSLNSTYESGFAIDGTYSGGKSVINLNAFGVSSGGPYSADIAFKTSTNTTLSEKMRITNEGNVGIGTTSPSNRFQIDGTAGLNNSFASFDSSDFVRMYADASFGSTLNWSTGDALRFATSDNNFGSFSEKMRITSGGNILMNTTTDPTTGGYTNTTLLVKQLADGSFGGGLQIEEAATTNVAYFGFNGSAFNIGTSYRSTGAYNPITFSTSGTERIRIAASGNVGIGTTNPGVKLDVVGTTETSIRVRDTGGSSLELYQQATDSYIIATNSTRFYNSGSERVIITSAGNVGIGTTSPITKLEVDGTVTISGPSAIKWKYSDNYAYFGIGYISGDDYGFYNYNYGRADLYIQQSSGNIGIGTTTPSEKLSVNGNIALPKTGETFIYNDQSASDSVAIGGASYLAFSTYSSAWTERMRILSGGNVGIGTNVPQTKLEVRGSQNNTIAPANGVAKFVGGDAGVFVGTLAGTPSYGSWLQTMRESDALTFPMILNPLGGDIGIGISNPFNKLHIDGSSGIRISDSSNSNFRGITFGATGGDSTEYSYIKWQPNSGEFRLYANTAGFGGYMTFYSNNSEAMRINSSGNVGIGTTSIAGNSTNRVLSIEGSDSSNLIITETGGASATFTSFGNEAYLGTSTNHPLYLYTSGSERLRIATNGALKFNAYGSGTFTGTAAQKLAVDSSGNLIEIPIGAGPVDGSGTANYITRWSDTDTITTSSIYETGGNIGIGTISPTTPLEVVGASRFNHTSGTGQTNISTFINSTNNAYASITAAGVSSVVPSWIDGSMIMEFVPYSTGNAIFSAYNGDITFQTNARTEYMRITSAGNVGINTVTPAYKLSVVGKMALNDGGNSVFIGDNAGLSDDATNNTNVGVGTNALQNNIAGAFNVAVGAYTLQNHLGSFNTALGSHALQFLTIASANNTAVGSYALNANLTGSNTAVGSAALLFTTSGSRNVAVGSNAGRLNTFGNRNISLGTAALYENITGSNNIAIGDNAGRYFGSGTSALTDTSGSIFIGNNARANANGSLNEIVIGTDLIGLGSNSVVLGNDNVTTTALKGNVGIGTTTPSVKLHVSGSISGSIFWPANAGGNYMQGDGSGLVVGGPSYFYSAGSNGSYFEGNVRIRGGLSNDTAAYMQINGGTSAQTFINGWLSVGTTSISAKIDTYGSIASNSGLSNASTRPAVSTGTMTNGEVRGYSVTSPSADDGFLRVSAGGGTNANTKSYIDLSGYSTVSDMDKNIVIGTSGTERMRIDTSGNVGIGTASPSYLLDVNGTARVTTLIETSALKYKTNIQPLEPQLSKVTQLEPVTFDWIDKPNPKTNIGLIADEVEKLYPEFVSKTEDGEIEGIEYSKLTTVLIQSIKELKEIVDKQQEQINTLLNK